jgi:hypothetical protein
LIIIKAVRAGWAYGIGHKGAAWLKRQLSLPYHKLDWKQKNHVGKLFLEHAFWCPT